MNDREHITSVLFLIVGDNFEPEVITKAIGIKPDRSWKKGDKETLPKGSVHTYSNSGWKKFQDPELDQQCLERQISYFIGLLSAKSEELKELKDKGLSLELNCFICSSIGLSFCITNEVLSDLHRLSLDLSFDFEQY